MILWGAGRWFQRASRCIRAIESGPPETAATSAPAGSRAAKRRSSPGLSNAGEFIRRFAGTAPIRSGAAGAFLFALGALPDAGGGLRVFAVEFGKDRAGAIPGAEAVESDAEFQQCVGSLRGVRVVGRDR